MFRTEDLLDLSQCPLPELFDRTQHPWDALRKLPEFVASHLARAPRGRPKLIGTAHIADDVAIGEGTVIEHGAVILGPTIIGANCLIRAHAYLRGNLLIGNHCVLGTGCEFKQAVIFHHALVPHLNYVGDSILGHQAHLGAGVILSNFKSLPGTIHVEHDGRKTDTGLRKFGAIIGDGADIGCNCVLNPGSIIGRRSILYPNISWRGVCPPDRIVKLRQSHEIILRRR